MSGGGLGAAPLLSSALPPEALFQLPPRLASRLSAHLFPRLLRLLVALADKPKKKPVAKKAPAKVAVSKPTAGVAGAKKSGPGLTPLLGGKKVGGYTPHVAASIASKKKTTTTAAGGKAKAPAKPKVGKDGELTQAQAQGDRRQNRARSQSHEYLPCMSVTCHCSGKPKKAKGEWR